MYYTLISVPFTKRVWNESRLLWYFCDYVCHNHAFLRMGEFSGTDDRVTETNRQTDRQTDRQTERQTNRQTERQRQTDRQTDRETDRETDRQTDRQRDRQTDR